MAEIISFTRKNQQNPKISGFSAETQNGLVSCDSSGVKIAKTSRRGFTEEFISPVPVWPVRAMLHADGTIWIVLQVWLPLPEQPTREVLVSLEELADPSQGGDGGRALRQMGVPYAVRGRLAPTLLAVVTTLMQQGSLPITAGTDQVGWVSTEQGLTHLMPGTPEYTGPESQVRHAVSGDPGQWVEALKSAVDGSPIAAALLSAAAASLARGPVLPTDTILWHVWGPTSRGKTTALKLAASLIGSPVGGGILGAWDVTPAALEGLLSRTPLLCLDESGLARGGTTDLMRIGNGVGRGRARRDGGVRITRQWAATVLSTGNSPLLRDAQRDLMDDAVATRIIEIDITNDRLFGWHDAARARRISEAVQSSHGHAYRWIVDTVAQDREELQARYQAAQDRVDRACATLRDAGPVSRRARGWVEIDLGAELLRRAIERAGFLTDRLARDLQSGVEWAWTRFQSEISMSESDEKDEKDSIREEALRLLTAHFAHVVVRGFLWSAWVDTDDKTRREQEKTSMAHSERARQAGVWMIMEQERTMDNPDDWEGTLWISTAVSDRLGVDLQALAARAEAAGMLVTQKGRGARRTVQKRGLGYAYAFRIESEAEEPAENTTPTEEEKRREAEIIQELLRDDVPYGIIEECRRMGNGERRYRIGMMDYVIRARNGVIVEAQIL